LDTSLLFASSSYFKAVFNLSLRFSFSRKACSSRDKLRRLDVGDTDGKLRESSSPCDEDNASFNLRINDYVKSHHCGREKSKDKCRKTSVPEWRPECIISQNNKPGIGIDGNWKLNARMGYMYQFSVPVRTYDPTIKSESIFNFLVWKWVHSHPMLIFLNGNRPWGVILCNGPLIAEFQARFPITYFAAAGEKFRHQKI
jgi:hypothetical protein